MAETVNILCSITSVICAALLVRGYTQTRSRLLLWSSVCFVGLALNNFLFVLDLLVVPTIDLSLMRSLAAAFGITVLVAGLVWDGA